MRVVEEFVLILVDDANGALRPIPQDALKFAIAGAALIDLEMAGRIDTDLDSIELLDTSPLGDDILDPVLREIADDPGNREIAYRTRKIHESADGILDAAIARLVQYNILDDPSESGVLGVTSAVRRSLRYVTVDSSKRELIDLRIQRVLFDDEIPDPGDIPVICLADACNLFGNLLTPDEIALVRDRIDTISRLSVIGQVVSRAIEFGSSEGFGKKRTALAPLAKGLPVVGSLLHVRGDLAGFLADRYREFGPVFRIRFVGKNAERVVLAGRDANLFLAGTGQQFVTSREAWKGVTEEFGGDRLLFSMDGPDHVRMRRLQQPNFSVQHALSRIDQTIDVVRQEASHWQKGQSIPGTHAMKRMFTAQLMSLAVGEPHWDYIDDLVYAIGVVLEAKLVKARKSKLKGKRFRESRRRVDELYEAIMNEYRLRLRKPEGNVLGSVLEIHESDGIFLPEIDFKLNVLLPLVAGTDTAGGVLAFMLYFILSDPGIKERVQAEADEFFSQNGGPSAQAVRGMSVLSGVMMESMRKFPTVSVLPRHVTTSFDFGGYRINAGQNVIFATSVTHFLDEYFPDPDRFDIERFSPQRGEHKLKGVYVPFGLGRHGCLGASLANVQVVLTMATLLHHYDLDLDPPNYQLRSTVLPMLSPDTRFKFKVSDIRN
ncbi:MAG: cytochrome P450 [Boseongicola sp. SB0675_bin_26]|nr:cytochrome P450 [Gemmatimonadota bacterium]MYH57091.1 cytochrome P450 [Boseongicola sp. SB0675_bin_26]